MNISFNLAKPSAKSSPVRVVITHNGKVYRKCTGITTATWLKSKHRSGNPTIDAKLRVILVGLESELSQFSTEKDILGALSRIEGGEWKEVSTEAETEEKGPSFYEYYRQWADRECTSKRQHQLAYRKVLGFMGPDWNWERLDSSFFAELKLKMKNSDMSVNYQGNVLARTKTVIKEAYELGIHHNNAFVHIHKIHEEAFSIALTPEEMDVLWNAKLKGFEGRVRDLAWLGYLTAARFSDYSRLKREMIVDGKISFVQKKTDNPVLIPCSPRVTEILDRNGGHAPKMASQVFNRNIKNVCRNVGINQVIQVTEAKRRIMHWEKDEIIYKWMLVSSHTLRRSACTELYRSGVPLALCCKVSGHRNPKQFLKYCKISNEDAADQLAQMAFFK